MTSSGNSSQVYCPPTGGCTFLAVQPASFLVDDIADPLVVARFSTLRSTFFTDQFLRPVPNHPGSPGTVDFCTQRPAVRVTLSNVNITCNSLVVHEMLPALPVPATPEQQLIQVNNDADLVDAITCKHHLGAWPASASSDMAGLRSMCCCVIHHGMYHCFII